METLKERLERFHNEINKINGKGKELTQDTLTEKFKDIAKWFLYGGYIKVGDCYRVYIHAVEFYFHCEEDSPYNVEDTKVYHRNYYKDFNDCEAPYFPLMTLHAHASGYDITFENEEKQYRASALIREYAVYNTHKERIPTLCKNKMNKGQYDNRSTFLYNYLNGFSLSGDNHIGWVDESFGGKTNKVKVGFRKGIDYDKAINRQWKFTRVGPIKPRE